MAVIAIIITPAPQAPRPQVQRVLHGVTHGTCIRNVKVFVQAFIDHRLERERQILECLAKGYTTIAAMVPVMYTDTDKSLHGAAARSVLAAMARLLATGKVSANTAEAGLQSHYRLA